MKLNERTSSKCDCKARFTFCCLSGDMQIHADHVGGCIPLTDEEWLRDSYLFKLGQSPSKENKLKEIIVKQIKSDWSTGNRSLQKSLNGN